MNDKSSDLEYVSNALRKAEGRDFGYPIIYCLWGVIIFVGYAVEEYLIQHISLYWSISLQLVGYCPLGSEREVISIEGKRIKAWACNTCGILC